MDILGFYAWVLFPFYPNASLNNKIKLTNSIIYRFFIYFRADQIVLCLPGLLTSLIQGLDDNNDTSPEQIFEWFIRKSKKECFLWKLFDFNSKK